MKDYFGEPIKKLGFGFMRLPVIGDTPEIDVEQVKKMVDLYMERGYTYFDTAYVYNSGASEEAVRAAVTERYPREKFQAATKLPLWKPANFEEMEETMQTSLGRMGLDFVDLYLLHGIRPDQLEMVDKIKAWDYLAGLRESGKAKNIGFSYHGDADTLNRILDEHAKDLDIVQLQINYLDWDDANVQSRKCYEAARAHGLGIVIMEPVKGGSLSNLTPEVANVFKTADAGASLASWALRFALGLDGVVTVLSGMSSFEQIQNNIEVADAAEPLTDADMKVIANAMEELKKVPTIPCTACGYCVPDCPQQINTPKIIGILNDYLKYQNIIGTKRMYGLTTDAAFFGHRQSAPASECIACGVCEQHCPQGIKIIETHKDAVKLFE